MSTKRKALTLALAVGVASSLTACQIPGGVTSQGWHAPSTNQGYGVWTHDGTDNGCNEWDSEPTAEVDNDGHLCESFVP